MAGAGEKTDNAIPKDVDGVREETLLKHREFLIENIDSDFGLLDDLRQNRSLTRREIEEIDRTSSSYKKNEALINAIIAKKQFGNFIKALRENQQSHIINYLIADGEVKEEFGQEWPLRENEHTILDDNYRTLVDLIEISELSNKVYAAGVINRRQLDYISSKSTSADKNKAFVEILTRKSLKDYWITIQCLRSTRQEFLAIILANGGATVRADFSVEGAREHDIVERIKDMLIHCSASERHKIFQELEDFCLIGATTGHSFSLYFHCLHSTDINQLEKAAESGRLAAIVEKVIYNLYSFSTKTSVKLKRVVLPNVCLVENKVREGGKPLKEFVRKQTQNEETSRHLSVKTINDLPFELLDIILQKSYLNCVLKQTSLTFMKEDKTFVNLASVDVRCFQRLTKRKKILRVSAKRPLVELYRILTSASTFVRNNRCYFQSCRQPLNLIKRLKYADCITDAQAACIYRRSRTVSTKKEIVVNQNCGDEFLEIMKSFDETRQFNHLRCLRESARKHMAKVVANARALVKIELNAGRGTERETTNSKLNQTLQALQEKWKPLSSHFDQFVRKLNENDLDILEAFVDRDVVCWIWFKMTKRFENLEQLQPLGILMEAFIEQFKTLGEKRLTINLDNEWLKKSYSLTTGHSMIDLVSRIDFQGYTYTVMGITKLRNKIYVNTSLGPTSILVYEDRVPFRLLRKIDVEAIHFITDLASSERENCLYANDDHAECIWKITEETDGQRTVAKAIEWLRLDFKLQMLSTTSDGQLLTMNGPQPPFTLRIYGSDAKLCFSFQLPEDVVYVAHAVATSNGDFIILHHMYLEGNKREVLVWAISQLSADGKMVIHRFIPEKGQEISGHSYLAVGAHNRVIITDKWNDRLVLLDKDLTWNRFLIQRESIMDTYDFEKPRILFYDEDKEQLLMGAKNPQSTAAAIYIYDFIFFQRFNQVTYKNSVDLEAT